ncbi:MAG: alternative ribosome rescue aminoacyl-tRNA hydrolase ArfB [Flavobacterium sp.]
MHFDTILREIDLKAVRSSGAGGQHVNKVATKVQLFFNVKTSAGLNEEEKELLVSSLASKITDEGVLILQDSDTRSQTKNKERVIQKLYELLQKHLTPKKKRKKTSIPKAVVEKRLQVKKKLSEVKKLRKRPL